jgi:phenylacetic acid degradation operon negative regulatory protein
MIRLFYLNRLFRITFGRSVSCFSMPRKKIPAAPAWLTRYADANPPRAKSFVMTLFGDVIAPHGGEVWLGSLIELLAPFGINDRLVRTSVYRLAEEGWLDARRSGRRSRYTLDPRSAARFERAHRRIYAPVHGDWNGQWTLVLTNAGTLTAAQRTLLRKELLWQGYRAVAPHVLAHPAPDMDTLADILARHDAADGVIVCAATQPEPAHARPLGDLVAQCWELDPVMEDYRRFIADFGVLAALLEDETDALAPATAFIARVLMVHAFRRVRLHDPQLPARLLPPEWPGQAAYALCGRIYRATRAASEEFVDATLRREDEHLPGVAGHFHERFGGLA